MGYHEKIWLEQNCHSTLRCCVRYVDDTFCLIHSERDADYFFDFINSQHPNIHITIKKEVSHVLPFLDVLNDNKTPPVTSTYRVKTFTGVLHTISCLRCRTTIIAELSLQVIRFILEDSKR